MKKIKLSVIRDNDASVCPFGLSIPVACCNAGESITRMAPLEGLNDNKKESIKKANNLVYVYHKDGKECPFADKVLPKFDKVDCDFGDTGQGQRSIPLAGSPLYVQTFSGLSLNGLYGYPLGYWADNNQSRNLFFGLFSFLGKEIVNGLVKLADNYDDCGESEKASKIDTILAKLNDMKNTKEFDIEFDKLEEQLKEYRNKYDATSKDTGLLFELMEKWLGPRQSIR